MPISIQCLIEDAKCYQIVRDLRWAEGVHCPHCNAREVAKNGYDTPEVHRQRYRCHSCRRYRGISQEHLPLYLAFFELTHNLHRRGKALFESLIATFLQPSTQKRK